MFLYAKRTPATIKCGGRKAAGAAPIPRTHILGGEAPLCAPPARSQAQDKAWIGKAAGVGRRWTCSFLYACGALTDHDANAEPNQLGHEALATAKEHHWGPHAERVGWQPGAGKERVGERPRT
jgi:hypothetical protein